LSGMRRRTKIVATLGPASTVPETLRAMVDAGVDVFRLNASHGDHEFFSRVVPQIRATADEAGRVVAILLDLRGPKIRVGRLAEDSVELRQGTRLRISTEDFEGTAERIPCTYDGIARDVAPGDRILLDDGLMEVRVTELVSATEIECEVVSGGRLEPNKGINVPGQALSTPAFGEKDLRDLRSGIELGVDFVALSFVRRPEDLRDLRRAMHDMGGVAPIIAKIEKPQALDVLDEILDECDGVMVARGDLGVEIPPEQVPSAQKRIIARANAKGLPVITATQMLESMIEHPRPTRAEASDVANAIFDGTDAVMLSGETAAGAYPVGAVQMMDRIAREAESSEFYGRIGIDESQVHGFDVERLAVAKAARRIAQEIEARFIVVYTLSGATAQVMSKFRSRRTILALCPDPAVCRRMCLQHGILPRVLDYYDSTDDMLREGDRLLLDTHVVNAGDRVVVLGGTQQFAGVSNMIQIREAQPRETT
jgi:pyruvate kinase